MRGSTEQAIFADFTNVNMGAAAGASDSLEIKGYYSLECTDENGNVLWTDTVNNVVTTVGQNQILTNGLTTTTYMLLISSASFSAVAAGDTMSSHAGWLEADNTNAPEYSGNRPSVTWGSPSGGQSIITPTQFVFTNGGTVQGIAMTFGTGASATQGATTGVLLSAGTLSVPQPVISGNTVNASYTLAL